MERKKFVFKSDLFSLSKKRRLFYQRFSDSLMASFYFFLPSFVYSSYLFKKQFPISRAQFHFLLCQKHLVKSSLRRTAITHCDKYKVFFHQNVSCSIPNKKHDVVPPTWIQPEIKLRDKPHHLCKSTIKIKRNATKKYIIGSPGIRKKEKSYVF